MKHLVRSLCVLTLVSSFAFAQEPNWNQFRGPNHNNHAFSKGIAKSWGEGGPTLLWKINTLGAGWANICFFDDRIYAMGDVDNKCHAFALERATGKEIWRKEIGRAGGGGGFLGPCSTPACDGQTVYVMGQFGNFVALDVKDGAIRWQKDIEKELGGAKMNQWNYAMSPMLDGDKIVVPIGGNDGTLAAFDKSGKLLWRSAPIKDPAAYTSVAPVEIAGVKQYLLLTGNSLVGLSPTDGKILWGANFPGKTAVCSDPALCGDVIMASCSYEVGAFFYRVTKEGNTFKASDFDGARRELQCHHGGIVTVGEHFYLMTNSQRVVCVEAKTGKVVWENRGVGKGSLTYADGVLVLRCEAGAGTVAMIEATPTGYKELGRFDQPDRSDKSSWTYPVIVDKKLYLRDQGLLLCYDLN
jgi:outer membrane protein assembly factor BamB